MTEYIDREAAMLKVGINSWAGSRLLSIPAENVFKVVLCKDCRKHRTIDCPFGITIFDAPKADDFCSRGEKR